MPSLPRLRENQDAPTISRPPRASGNSCFPSHVLWGRCAPCPELTQVPHPRVPEKVALGPPRGRLGHGASARVSAAAAGPTASASTSTPVRRGGTSRRSRTEGQVVPSRHQGASANSPAHRSPSPWLGFYRLIFFTVFSGIERLAPSSSSTDCGGAAKQRRFKYGMLRCTAM